MWTFANKIHHQNKNLKPEYFPWNPSYSFCFTFEEAVLFLKPFAIYVFILSYSCPWLLFVSINIFKWEQGEICNQKVNSCRHMKKDWLCEAKQNCGKFSILQQYHVGSSQPAFCALSRYSLEQGGWLTKSAGTKRKAFNLQGVALNILFWCQIGLPWSWWGFDEPLCMYSIDDEDTEPWEAGKALRERTDGRLHQNALQCDEIRGSRASPLRRKIWAIKLRHLSILTLPTEGRISISQAILESAKSGWLFSAPWHFHFNIPAWCLLFFTFESVLIAGL